MSGLDDQAEVRRETSAVRRPGSLLVRIWSRQIITELPRACKHLSSIIWAILIFGILSLSSCLVSGVRRTNKIAPGDTAQRMARRADFPVHLEASTDTRKVQEYEGNKTLAFCVTV